jgi:hypothetical protein
MILVAMFALVVASVPLFGGRMSRLVDLPLRHTWVIMVALVAQTVLISVLSGVPERVGNVVHLATYAVAFGFLALNHRLPGLKLLVIGGGLNLVAIVANGGVMPSTAWATRTAGLVPDPDRFTNSSAVEHPHLIALGDVFAIPSGWPLSNVFSVGDVVLVVGAAVLLHVGSGSRLAGAPRDEREDPVRIRNASPSSPTSAAG